MAADGYVKHPGGVILHLTDGTTELREYGAPVSYDELADYQQETVDQFLSKTPTKPIHDLQEQEQSRERIQEDEQFEHVPTNYGELDEEGALGVVRSFNRSPVKQGQVLAYEALHQNRQSVLDGATPSGQAKADEILGKRGDEAEMPAPSGEIPEPSSE